MLGITLMILGGFAIGWAIYDSFDDDDGADNDQDLTGTEGNDTLEGGSGNDALTGLGGDDDLVGNGGNDRITGNDGDDIGIGGDGNDTVRGSEGNDLLQGNDGSDRMFGDRGDDWAAGGAGDDAIGGGSGNDVLIGGDGADNIQADGGDDALFGGDMLERALTQDELDAIRAAAQAGEPVTYPVDFDVTDDGQADRLDAGRGDDDIFAGSGDEVRTGEGADTVFLIGGETVDPTQVTDFTTAEDALFYVYEPTGEEDPEVDVTDNGDDTYSVQIDGQIVAVVRSDGPIAAEDITLYALGGGAAG